MGWRLAVRWLRLKECATTHVERGRSNRTRQPNGITEMLTLWIETWNSVYANHAAVRTTIEFAHIAGLIVGGGCAITADLATLTAAREGSITRLTELQLLKRTHRVVIIGLVAVFVSGFLLLAADVDTYLHSRVFWVKMLLVAVLLANGALLVRGEKHVVHGDGRSWTRLHHTAVASLTLWLVTTLVGAMLPNLG